VKRFFFLQHTRKIFGSSRFTNEDVLVSNGDASDVYNQKKNTDYEFFRDNDIANIIMLHIPHKYDLTDNAYVNKEIKTFTSKLKKIAKLFKHITILEFSFNRNCFTQHGLHLNGCEKGLLAKQMLL